MNNIFSRLVLPALLLASPALAHAQTFAWAQTANGTAADNHTSIAPMPDGGVVVGGYFSGTLALANGSTLATAGTQDGFVARYAANGALLWVRQQAATGTNTLQRLATDAAGNIYTTGNYFNSPLSLPTDTGAIVLPNAGNNDIFVAKYTPNGRVAWAFRLAGSLADVPTAIATNGTYVALGGTFRNTVDFDPGAGTANLTASTSTETFIATYSAGGAYVRAGRLTGTSTRAVNALALDAKNYLYAAGNFGGTLNPNLAGGAATSLATPSNFDGWMARYTPGGALQWARQIGAPNTADQLSALAVLPKGVAVAGSFEATIDLDAGPGTHLATSNGLSDALLMQYDSSGAFVWGQATGGPGYDRATNLTVDAVGNIGLAGYFQQTFDADPGAGAFLLAAVGGYDASYAQYGPGGAFQYAFSLGSTGNETNAALAFGAPGTLYVGGNMLGIIDAAPGAPVQNIPYTTAEDGYVARYGIPVFPPAAYVRAASCGFSFGLVGDQLAADEVPNATQYRFRYTNTASGTVSTANSPNRYTLLSAAVPALQYGATYQVAAQAQLYGTFGPYGTACPLYTVSAVVPSTKLRPFDCNRTITTPAPYVLANPVPAADNYTFRFYTPTGALAFSYNGGKYNQAMLAGLPNGTYKVAVTVMRDNITANPGPNDTCIIHMALPGAPRTLAADAQPDLLAFPNPFAGTATLQLPPGAMQVQVLDLAGRVLQTLAANGQTRLPIGEGLPSGLYIVRAGHAVLRIIKE